MVDVTWDHASQEEGLCGRESELYQNFGYQISSNCNPILSHSTMPKSKQKAPKGAESSDTVDGRFGNFTTVELRKMNLIDC
jgi:hypothetical protein